MILPALAAVTLMLPAQWGNIPTPTTAEIVPPCHLIVTSKDGRQTTCLWWGHRSVSQKRYFEPEKNAAIWKAMMNTPSGQCAIGTIDPDGHTVDCAKRMP